MPYHRKTVDAETPSTGWRHCGYTNQQICSMHAPTRISTRTAKFERIQEALVHDLSAAKH
jgi:hypothetical protein